jgi:hypothetical protein
VRPPTRSRTPRWRSASSRPGSPARPPSSRVRRAASTTAGARWRTCAASAGRRAGGGGRRDPGRRRARPPVAGGRRRLPVARARVVRAGPVGPGRLPRGDDGAGRPRPGERVDLRPHAHGSRGAGARAVGGRPRRGARARRDRAGRGGRPVARRPAGPGAGDRAGAAPGLDPARCRPADEQRLLRRHADRGGQRLPARVGAVPPGRRAGPPPEGRRRSRLRAPHRRVARRARHRPLRHRLLPLVRGQVDVFARKPRLAAVPGTSRHGLGVALDLGCGVESFGTEAHRWMQANGPRFGWVHPAWAGPRGSLPEPWHWEHVG